MFENPIICAIDSTELEKSKALASDLKDVVGAVKLGLEFFTAHGPEGIKCILKTGVPVFLDLKFHDIPNTVAGAVRAACELGVNMLTVHTLGGSDMLKAAVETASEVSARIGKPRPLIVGVTVLTSMDTLDLQQTGMGASIEAQVTSLAELAIDNGLDGCICSSHEIGRVRDNLGNDIKLIVPGIRPRGSDLDDQKRIMTPEEAMRQGADYLVIGRPITKSKNPIETAKSIIETIV